MFGEYKFIFGEYEEVMDVWLKSVCVLDFLGWCKDFDLYEDYVVVIKVMVEGVLNDIEVGRGGSADSFRFYVKSVVKVGEK